MNYEKLYLQPIPILDEKWIDKNLSLIESKGIHNFESLCRYQWSGDFSNFFKGYDLFLYFLNRMIKETLKERGLWEPDYSDTHPLVSLIIQNESSIERINEYIGSYNHNINLCVSRTVDLIAFTWLLFFEKNWLETEKKEILKFFPGEAILDKMRSEYIYPNELIPDYEQNDFDKKTF